MCALSETRECVCMCARQRESALECAQEIASVCVDRHRRVFTHQNWSDQWRLVLSLIFLIMFVFNKCTHSISVCALSN